MDCKYAYEKSGYVMCKKMGQTAETDPRKLASKMCPFQIFCHTKNCQKLIPNWKNLCKLWNDEPKAVVEIPQAAEQPKKKTTKKKATAE